MKCQENAEETKHTGDGAQEMRPRLKVIGKDVKINRLHIHTDPWRKLGP